MNDKILNPCQIDYDSPTWKDGHKFGKKTEGLASLKREKEAWVRGVEQAIEVCQKKVFKYDGLGLSIKELKRLLRK